MFCCNIQLWVSTVSVNRLSVADFRLGFHQEPWVEERCLEPWKNALVTLYLAPSLTLGIWPEWRRWTPQSLLQVTFPLGQIPTMSSTCGRSQTAVGQNRRTATGNNSTHVAGRKKKSTKRQLASRWRKALVLFLPDLGFTSVCEALRRGSYWRSTWWTWTTKGSSTVRAWLL